MIHYLNRFKLKKKLFYFALHPIPYHIGIYREVSKIKNIDFKVIYLDNIGIKPVFNKDFRAEIKWDIDLTKGYKSEFLKNYSFNFLKLSPYFSRLNFGIVRSFFQKPDIVLITGYTTFSDMMILILSKITRTKVIYRGEATLRKNTSASKEFIKKYFLKIWLKNCDIVMYSCSGNKDFYLNYGVDNKKLLPIPCAVDNDYFQNKDLFFFSRKQSIKKELLIEEEDFVILFSGRFTARKHPLDLLKSLKIIDNSKITVVYVGDGPEIEKCKSFSLKNNIKTKYVGFVNSSQVSKFYSIANLFVNTSDYDPSPKTLNEAMNFSLSVIATNVIGTSKDLIQNNKNGFTIAVGDIKDLGEKINYLNNNRTINDEFGKLSKKIINKFTFKKDAEYINKAVKILSKNT